MKDLGGLLTKEAVIVLYARRYKTTLAKAERLLSPGVIFTLGADAGRCLAWKLRSIPKNGQSHMKKLFEDSANLRALSFGFSLPESGSERMWPRHQARKESARHWLLSVSEIAASACKRSLTTLRNPFTRALTRSFQTAGQAQNAFA